MLDHPVPLPFRSRRRRYPKLGPHIGSIQQLLRENDTLPPSARLSTRAIYEHIRDTEGFRGGCNTVKDYVRAIASDKSDGTDIWENAYNLLVSFDKRRAIDFLFLLSRADPPIISKSRAEQFFCAASR
jgi:hypothetical protein